MHLYINIMGVRLPSYGLMIVLGITAANLIAAFRLRKRQSEFDDFVIMECYGALGGMLGAKLLYLIISAKWIEWKRIGEHSYLKGLLQGGFVFYGGLLGGILAVRIAENLHHIRFKELLCEFIFLVPLVHGFGRIGCFLAGCCFGIPYHGPLAVTFPKESFAITGIRLFPVQLTEAVFLFGLAFWLSGVKPRKGRSQIKMYLVSYGVGRFHLEFLRYDAIRGGFGGLSSSQWISIIIVLFVMGEGILADVRSACYKKKRT